MSSAFVEGITICLVIHARNLRDMLTLPSSSSPHVIMVDSFSNPRQCHHPFYHAVLTILDVGIIRVFTPLSLFTSLGSPNPPPTLSNQATSAQGPSTGPSYRVHRQHIHHHHHPLPWDPFRFISSPLKCCIWNDAKKFLSMYILLACGGSIHWIVVGVWGMQEKGEENVGNGMK